MYKVVQYTIAAVTRIVDKDARDQVRALAGTEAYPRARQRRKRIERVFGHLKRNLKLRTLKLRELAGAIEEFTMAAAAYNTSFSPAARLRGHSGRTRASSTSDGSE